ncbi:MAG: hypothetical protein H0V25_12565 [Solirubrobacterales bacterium]|nr:hypothetical protein [Solirubrobacterales bacterium]
MDDRVRTFLLGSGILFLLVFAALTVVALSTATLNVATLVIGAVSLFIIVAVLLALIEAIRNPPPG